MISTSSLVEKYIKKATKDIERLENYLSVSAITRAPYIVATSTDAVVFAIVPTKNGRTTGVMSTTTNPLDATGFTQRDAETVAAALTNGRGEPGVVVGQWDAVRRVLEITRDTLEMWEQIVIGIETEREANL